MNTNRRSYELAILALLAACNAGLELSLGNYLHAVKFPMTGMIMVGVNLIVYTIGYTQVPRRGTIITMGFISALLNLFLSGTFKIWAIPAIFLESAIIELFIGFLGMRFWPLVAASVSASLFGAFWQIGVIGLVLGRGISENFILNAGKLLGGPEVVKQFLVLAIILMSVIHVVSGFAFAGVAWRARSLTAKITRREHSVGEVG